MYTTMKGAEPTRGGTAGGADGVAGGADGVGGGADERVRGAVDVASAEEGFNVPVSEANRTREARRVLRRRM